MLRCFGLFLFICFSVCNAKTPSTTIFGWQIAAENSSIPTVPVPMVNQNVYVSIATMAKRIGKVAGTLSSVMAGSVAPSRIFLFVSKEPYLLDTGVKELPDNLVKLTMKYPITVVYTNNIGPHRKLLPLLWKKWEEDCVLITLDDDLGANANKNLLSQLLKYYVAGDRQSVVALRSRRIGLCIKYPHNVLRYSPNWSLIYSYGNKEMLVLPTGTGGVLYRPRFFNPIVFEPALRELTYTTDDIMFRLSTMVNNVSVVIACEDIIHRGKVVRRCPSKAVAKASRLTVPVVKVISPVVARNVSGDASKITTSSSLSSSSFSMAALLAGAAQTNANASIPVPPATQVSNILAALESNSSATQGLVTAPGAATVSTGTVSADEPELAEGGEGADESLTLLMAAIGQSDHVEGGDRDRDRDRDGSASSSSGSASSSSRLRARNKLGHHSHSGTDHHQQAALNAAAAVPRTGTGPVNGAGSSAAALGSAVQQVLSSAAVTESVTVRRLASATSATPPLAAATATAKTTPVVPMSAAAVPVAKIAAAPVSGSGTASNLRKTATAAVPPASASSGASPAVTTASTTGPPPPPPSSSSTSPATSKTPAASASASSSASSKTPAATTTTTATGQPKTKVVTGKNSLYAINRRDGNDAQWHKATQFLETRGLLSFAEIASKYMAAERGQKCLLNGHRHRSQQGLCSVKNCSDSVIRPTVAAATKLASSSSSSKAHLKF